MLKTSRFFIKFITFALISLSVLVAAPVAVARNAQLVDSAIAAQDRGDFQQAIDAYEQLIASDHVNAYVYFNLGNAYYRVGQPGAAAAAYLAASKYLPRSPDVKANLAYARKSARDNLVPEMKKPWWAVPAMWADYFNTKELAYSCAVVWAVACLMFLGGVMYPRAKSPLQTLAIGALLIAGVTAYGIVVKSATANRWGAVTADTAKIYSGPNETSNTLLFELHEAAPVQVEQTKDKWFQVAISDGKRGWIKHTDMKVY